MLVGAMAALLARIDVQDLSLGGHYTADRATRKCVKIQKSLKVAHSYNSSAMINYCMHSQHRLRIKNC